MNTDRLKISRMTLVDWNTAPASTHEKLMVSGVVEDNGHSLSICPWVADCGANGETVYCSCGISASANVRGHKDCFIHSEDDHPMILDRQHQMMYDEAWFWWGKRMSELNMSERA